MNAPFQSDQVFMPQCVTSAERCAAIWASLFDWAVVMFWNIIVVFCFSHGAVLNRELLHCTRSDSIEFIVCVCMRILHLLLIMQYISLHPRRQYLPPRFSISGIAQLIESQYKQMGETREEKASTGAFWGGLATGWFLAPIAAFVSINPIVLLFPVVG